VTLFAWTAIAMLLRRRYRRGLEEQKMAVIGVTSARILHQIKNPVQSLLLQAELLEEFERDGLSEARREASRAILGEAMRLADMLNELSAWTAGGRRPHALQPTSLREVLEHIVVQERADAQRRGVCFDAALEADAVVAADAYYLRQAIENLIRNAFDALRDRPGAQLRLTLRREGNSASIRVIDNGPGISQRHAHEIFEPFVSTKSSGMGLGLAISREIVERHGGELSFESAPGAGSTFTVRLPVLSGGEAAEPRGGGRHVHPGERP
jgi:signal transduction histidine kinase